MQCPRYKMTTGKTVSAKDNILRRQASQRLFCIWNFEQSMLSNRPSPYFISHVVECALIIFDLSRCLKCGMVWSSLGNSKSGPRCLNKANLPRSALPPKHRPQARSAHESLLLGPQCKQTKNKICTTCASVALLLSQTKLHEFSC